MYFQIINSEIVQCCQYSKRALIIYDASTNINFSPITYSKRKPVHAKQTSSFILDSNWPYNGVSDIGVYMRAFVMSIPSAPGDYCSF